MKIGYFITHFPYKGHFEKVNAPRHYVHGGAEETAYNLAVHMARRGHEISIFTTSANSEDTIERYENINIYRYGTNFRIAGGNVSFKLFREPLKYELDIIHAHHCIQIGELAGYRYAKKTGKPFIITYHDEQPPNYGSFIRRFSVSFYNRYMLNRVLSQAEVIISPSKYFIDESRYLGKYRDKIAVIPNGVNAENFEIPYSKQKCRNELNLPVNGHIVLFVGAFIPSKGLDTLIQAMPKVIQQIPNTSLVLAGSGMLREKLKGLSAKLGLEKRVVFSGFIEDDFRKALYYKSADVFVLPSIAEIFPLVLLEASAAGLPMVVSNISVFKDLIEDGYNGLVAEMGDKDSFANAIIYLLKNKERRDKMSRNAAKRAKEYSWDKVSGEVEKLYMEINLCRVA